MSGKKLFATFLLFSCLAATCEMVSTYGSSAFKEKLNGHAAKLMDSTWYLNNDSSGTSKAGYLVKVYAFNMEGTVTGWALHAPDVKDTSAIDMSLLDVQGKFNEDLLLQRDGRLGIKMKDQASGNTGLLGESFAIAPDGKSYKRYSRTFDKNYNLLEIEQFNPDSSFADKYSFIYNASQQLTECRQYDAKGAIVKQIKYTYDTNGLEAGYAVYDANDQLIDQLSFTYSDHDEVGNWRKRSCYKNNKPFAITQRTLAYYD